ncbi:MAG: hypothetical protein J7555_05820 [Chloroflexi bacterium]|nr:hypothetical protein [Chloroflexota bacterium]
MKRWMRIILALHLIALFLGIGLFAYMGYFSRFIADDYCFSIALRKGPFLNSLIFRYSNSAGGDRYTNILLFDLAERLGGMSGMRFFPAALIGLWTLGLIAWLLILRLPWDPWISVFLAAWLSFYALWQAPQRYQTLYWHSSSVTHFAPLAFAPSILAFLSWQIQSRRSSFWLDGLNALLFFLLGGFSEPPTAMLITALMLLWGSTYLPAGMPPAWRRWLFWPLLGLLVSMGVMILSPANSIRMDAPPPLPLFLWRVAIYPALFILDTLRTQPLPTLLTFLGPMLLFSLTANQELRLPAQRHRAWVLTLLLLALTYLLIAASFAPSAYGQSYPVARARFTGQVLMTAALTAGGLWLGLRLRPRPRLQSLMALALILMALYPLRAAWKMWQSELPLYQQRAAAWDARQARILSQIAEGRKEIIVEQIFNFQQVKELDSDPSHWVNRCAARYYGVESIRAIPASAP